MTTELTSGSFGHKWFWFNWWFRISLDQKGLVIKVPFYTQRIPINKIKLVNSKTLFSPLGGEMGNIFFLGDKVIEIVYDHPKGTRKVWFCSAQPENWFEAFEKLNLKTHDPEQLSTKPVGMIKLSKKINSIAALIALLAAGVGLLAAVASLCLLFWDTIK